MLFYVALPLFRSTATPQHYFCFDGSTLLVLTAAPHHVLEVTAAPLLIFITLHFALFNLHFSFFSLLS
jgi:hypothetical protein